MSSFLNAGQAACTVTTKRQAPHLPGPTIPPRQAPRLLDQLREQIRYLHYSMSTEDAYVHWCKAFILFHGKQHPKDSSMRFRCRRRCQSPGLGGRHGLETTPRRIT